MSSRYRIGGEWVEASYIKEIYESNFREASEIFTHYLGAYLRLELVKTRIKTGRSRVQALTYFKGKIEKCLRLTSDLRFPVTSTILLVPDFKSYDLDLDYWLITSPAHEFSEGPYRFIRAKMYNLQIKDKKMAIFFEIMSNSFAENFRSLYCDVKGLEFKPHPIRGIITKRYLAPNPIYEHARYNSAKYKNRSLRFKARLLQALLFQKHEPIVEKKDPTKTAIKATENEFKRAEKHAKK